MLATSSFLVALLTLASLATPSTSQRSDANEDLDWIASALADPESDRGWDQKCQNDWDDDRRIAYCEVREFTYARSASPIAISGGQNSGMTVIGWNRSDVRMIYRVHARARTIEQAKDLAKSITVERSGSWVKPRGPETTSGQWWSVEIKAFVPYASDLGLKTLNGPLGVRDVHGTMDISATNGPVSLVRLGGAIVARVQNGPLHVVLEGSRWNGRGLDAEAQNGPVNLEIPKNYSARLETGTINGPTDYDYAIELQSARNRGYVTATLGSGGPPVRVVTSNGPFHVAAAR